MANLPNVFNQGRQPVEPSNFPFLRRNYRECHENADLENLATKAAAVVKNCKIGHLHCSAPAIIENSNIKRITGSHLFLRNCTLEKVSSSDDVVYIGEGAVKKITAMRDLYVYRKAVDFEAEALGRLIIIPSEPAESMTFRAFTTPGNLSINPGVKSVFLEEFCCIGGDVVFADDGIAAADKKVVLKPGARLTGAVLGGELIQEELAGVVSSSSLREELVQEELAGVASSSSSSRELVQEELAGMTSSSSLSGANP